MKILGVDPSKFMCQIAKKRKIQTYNTFFNLKNSQKIKGKFGCFDILYAANVFNHVDNPDNFLKGCNKVLKENGIIVLEVPDLDSLIATCGFDTIYHEHRQYFSSNSIKKILTKNNYELIGLDKINYMSGSLRIFAKKNLVSKRKLFLKSNTTYQKKNT